MLEYFLPKENNYFNFFETHANLIVKASEMFLKMTSNSPLNLSSPSNPIRLLEHEADQVMNACLTSLHTTFITPIDREDIYRLVSSMDDIIDAINKAYTSLLIFKLNVSTPELIQLAEIVHRSTQKVEKIVRGLRLMEKIEEITLICVEIHLLENEADDLLNHSVARLFEEESDTRLIIKWKEVYESLEKATDYCEDVADAVQGILLESM